MDATYRADLRELNELNFARFDAKLEQRITQVQAKMDALRAELIKWMFIFWAGTVIPVVGMVSLNNCQISRSTLDRRPPPR